MGASIDFLLWKTLSKKSCLIFGEECASVIIWVVVCLLFRSILVLTKLENSAPKGLVYALPYFIQLLSSIFPFMKRNYPILSVRLAECLLGKSSPTRIFILIPAHLIGGVVGVVSFRTLLPFLPNSVFSPLPYRESWWISNLIYEILFNFIYITVVLVVPHLMEINRINKKCLSLPMLPFLLNSSTFNPAILYGLWYVQGCSFIQNVGTLPIERIAGPIMAAILAGIFCNIYFPDNPASWVRKKTI